MNAQNQFPQEWWTTLDWVVKNALANQLTVILDEHDFNLMASNAAGNKPKLLAFWQQVAERYKDQPNAVVFEILNEPNGQLDAPAWNALLKECLALIRKTNPTRNVIIGPPLWNNVNELDHLELPAEDRNIIATVHYYLPMEFTHQGARWNAATANLSGITWGTDRGRSDRCCIFPRRALARRASGVAHGPADPQRECHHQHGEAKSAPRQQRQFREPEGDSRLKRIDRTERTSDHCATQAHGRVSDGAQSQPAPQHQECGHERDDLLLHVLESAEAVERKRYNWYRPEPATIKAPNEGIDAAPQRSELLHERKGTADKQHHHHYLGSRDDTARDGDDGA
jgi:hypothetical protein